MEGNHNKAYTRPPKKNYQNSNFKQKNGPAPTKFSDDGASNYQNMNHQGPPRATNSNQPQGSRKAPQASSTNFNMTPPESPQQQQETVPLMPIGDQNNLENLLKCTICSTVRKPPIFCCSGGHNVCSVCRATKIRCTVCNLGLSDVRNLCAEQLVKNYRFPCTFGPQGCNELLSFDSEGKHIGDCDFRPVGCEVYPCTDNRIDRQNYIEHQRKNHHAMNAEIVPSNTTGRMTWRRDIGVKNLENLLRQGMRPPTIMEFAGYTFFLRTQAAGHKIWFWVALFGSPEDAKRFKTKITIKKGQGNNEISASWNGPVHSVRHTGNDIYMFGLCMVSTEECLKALLFKKNGKSHYTTEIEIDCIA